MPETIPNACGKPKISVCPISAPGFTRKKSSYIPYPGAMPIVVNSLRDDADSDPKEYRLCMEDKGYWHRTYNLPSVTNIYVYKPQRVLQDVPFNNNDY